MTSVKDCARDDFPNIWVKAPAQEKKKKKKKNVPTPFGSVRIACLSCSKGFRAVCSCLHLFSCSKNTDISACTPVPCLLTIVEALLQLLLNFETNWGSGVLTQFQSSFA